MCVSMLYFCVAFILFLFVSAQYEINLIAISAVTGMTLVIFIGVVYVSHRSLLVTSCRSIVECLGVRSLVIIEVVYVSNRSLLVTSCKRRVGQ